LELYAQLNDFEFAYVSELQGTYDATRCFFLQWVLGKEIKELVNSARIFAVQSGKRFTWIDALAETLKSMTDVTLTARFLALARLKRTQGTTAKLWISQVLTRKALLEDPKLPAPIELPECLYLESLVGQMSAQETTVFDHCPAIGDDLLQNAASGQRRFTLDKLKRSIDACSNPPYFRGVSTPITDLLDAVEPKPNKQKRHQSKDKDGKAKDGKSHPRPTDKDKGSAKPNPHLARRPEHEKPANLPDGLKRSDLEAVVDGNKIASEAQRQLYDDVKRGHCTCCHKGGHIRKDCTEPKAKWDDKFDDKFDKEKTQYWTSVLKWQQKAAEQKTNPKDATRPPTLHVKPEKRFNILHVDSDSDDDSATMRHYRFTLHDDDDEDNFVYVPMVEEAIHEVEFVPPPLTVAAILADVDRQLADHPIDVATVPNDSDDVDMSDEDHAHLVQMDTHVRAIMAGANSRLLVLNTALAHAPPLPPLTDDNITAQIAEIYAYYYAETSIEDEIPVDPLAEHRPPTPYHVPDSPLVDSPFTHDDITYALSTASIASSRPPLPTPTAILTSP
jgi:hypothetical protein